MDKSIPIFSKQNFFEMLGAGSIPTGYTRMGTWLKENDKNDSSKTKEGEDIRKS